MKAKLHVLFFCGWYPSRVLPTNGDFIERHALAISTRHQVTVIHMITDITLTQNIEIISKEKKNFVSHIAYIKGSKNPLKKLRIFVKAYFQLIALTKPFQIVHLNEVYPFGIFALFLKWLKSKPFIISEHYTGYHQPQARLIPIYQKLLSKIITKYAAFICPVSNDLRDAMIHLNFQGNYVRVPNVVNTKIFKPLEKNPDIFTITHISNMVNTHKNIEGILKVIKKLENKITNFKVQIIGDNSKKFKVFAQELKIDLNKIEFIDQIPHAEIVSYLQKSSVFVLFSNYENLPCVILESFACGIPVISTNVGGIKEFFPKEFGFLIPSKDESVLLDKILDTYQNVKVNKEEMYQFVVKNFSENKISRDFEKLYYQSLKSFI